MGFLIHPFQLDNLRDRVIFSKTTSPGGEYDYRALLVTFEDQESDMPARVLSTKSLYIALVGLAASLILSSCGLLRRDVPVSLDELTREGFIKEMVIAKKTPATKYFTDYYDPPSYHVSKLDLVNGVQALSDSLTASVLALIVVGPAGPLWSYDVITVIDSNASDGSLALNFLRFSHARITWKATRLAARYEYTSFLEKARANPLLRRPTAQDSTEEGEWQSIFLIATFGDTPYVAVAPYPDSTSSIDAYDSLSALVNGVLDLPRMKTTYD